MSDLPSEMIEAGVRAYLDAEGFFGDECRAVYLAMRPHDLVFRQLVEAMSAVFDELGGRDDAADLRETLLTALLAAQQVGGKPV